MTKISAIITTLRVALFFPTPFQELNSIEVRKQVRIEYQFGFRTKNRLVEKLPQREFELDVF
jgi:hypothetical protein